MCRVSNKAGRSTNPTRQETSDAVLVAPERERLIGSADHRQSESEGGLVGTSPRANAACEDPICGVPTSPAPNEALSTSPRANAAREDPICGRDGRLPAGVSPLSSEQQNRELNLTRVQRAQLSVAMLNSAPLTPPTVEEASRWTGSAATLGFTATSAILTWRNACEVPSRRRFRPVFLDQVQWNQTDPRLASLARAASEFNAGMIKKYGVPFRAARADTTYSRADTDGNTTAC